MGTATRKLSDGAKNQGWLVRNEQGETFGPVDFETLKAWACDGRLAPSNEISENGVDWQLATASRPLEMNWVAEVSPGTFYGPIHKRAMEELVRDGSIANSGAFFTRCGLDGKKDAGSDEAWAERVRLLTEQHDQAQRRAAAAEGQAREALRLASEREEQVRQAQGRASEGEGQLRAARLQVAEWEERVRSAQGQAEQARQQAEALERQLRAQLAEHEGQMARRIAAYEEHVRLAQQQASAYAEQVGQVRQQAAESETRLRAAVQQVSEQAEQARAAQQQWMAKADGLADELEALRKTHAGCVAKAAELNAERDAQERARETERQLLSEALAQARSEAAEQGARLARLEEARRGARASDSESEALAVRLRTVSAELAGVQQALACERDAVRQAEARCAALEAALQAGTARDGDRTAMSDGVSAELRQLRQQIEALSALFREAQDERRAAACKESPPEGHPVKRVYVEAEQVEVLPPEKGGAAKAAPSPDAGRAAAEAPPRPADPAKAPVNMGRAGSGLSMAELEQQARRELERLGSQGANLFKRKK